MQAQESYQHILSLQSPWSVSEVKLDMESKEIRVRGVKKATVFSMDGTNALSTRNWNG
jgi:hypothetical protein